MAVNPLDLRQSYSADARCQRSGSMASAHFPKFVHHFQQSPSTNFGKAMGTSKFLILVPLFDLKSLGPFRREQCRDFKSAALAHAFRAIRPPSTGMTAPVRNEAAGRHRLKVMCATSSGSP